MKRLEDIVEIVDQILPPETKKTIFFCEVEDRAYECSYYAYFADGSCKQCYQLAEEELVDPMELEECFKKMVDFIRETPEYKSEKRNVVTIIIDGSREKVDFQTFDKSLGLYKLKKEWKLKYLQQ